MLATHYERLSTLDASFLSFEDRAAHMHVGSVSFFDAAPFQLQEGGLNFVRIEQSTMQILPKYPRLRQKLWWPAGGPPVFVDDAKFDPSYHFRRVGLHSPGTDVELKTLIGNILSSKLDPDRPLWEAWIIEGLEGNRFAIVWKIHHCVADGVSVRDILISYLGWEPSSAIEELAPFAPRPAPSVGRLQLDAALRRLEKSREASLRLQEFIKGAISGNGGGISDAAVALLQVGVNLLTDVTPTPLNGAIGPHRRFDWTSCDLGMLQEIRKESGAKINDVLLAAVCGAMRRYLLDKKIAVDDLPFRVMVPVSMRPQDGKADGGNRISNLTVPLPLYETDPRRRLQTVVEATTRAKASGQSWMGDTLVQALDWMGVQAPAALARFAGQQMPANLVVTNVPGPQRRQFLLESQLLDSFPVVPLARGQGLGIALYSYNGVVHWGFNADRDLMPDVGEFVKAVDAEVRALHEAHLPIQLRSRLQLRAVPGRPAAVAKATRRRAKVKRAK